MKSRTRAKKITLWNRRHACDFSKRAVRNSEKMSCVLYWDANKKSEPTSSRWKSRQSAGENHSSREESVARGNRVSSPARLRAYPPIDGPLHHVYRNWSETKDLVVEVTNVELVAWQTHGHQLSQWRADRYDGTSTRTGPLQSEKK